MFRICVAIPLLLWATVPAAGAEDDPVEPAAVVELRAAVDELKSVLDGLGDPSQETDLSAVRLAAERVTRAGAAVEESASETPEADKQRQRAAVQLNRVEVRELALQTGALQRMVEGLEQREELLTEAEAERLHGTLLDFTESIDRVASRKGSDSQVVRSAREVAERMALVELSTWVRAMREVVAEIEALQEAPTPEQRQQLVRRTNDLRGRIVVVRDFIRSSQAEEQRMRDAREVVTRSDAAEIMVEAQEEEAGRAEIVQSEEAPTEQELAELKPTVEVLQSKIKQADKERSSKAPEPEGLRRAREILARLAALSVKARLAPLEPQVAELERQARPPAREEIEPIVASAAQLDESLREYDANVPGTVDEEPDTIVQARGLLLRVARLDLASAYDRTRPFVEEMEARADPPEPEQVVRLRRIPDELRPRIRTLNRSAKGVDPDGEIPAEAGDAEALLVRVSKLIPKDAGAPEEPGIAPDTQPIVRPFRFYGSIRFRYLTDGRENNTIDEVGSRLGIRVEYPLPRKLRVFGRWEVAVNILGLEELDEKDRGNGEGGVDVTDFETLFPTRLLLAGLDVGAGSVSFGKQWSPWWDVAVFTDQLPFFGGRGNVTFPAATDGGVGGTGRADNALQYRRAWERVRLTAQTQVRDFDSPVVDGVGFSLVFPDGRKREFGVAFNQVLDGVPEPEPGQPKEGDSSLLLGYRYRGEIVYAAATASVFSQHETDDMGRYFDGFGVELYAHRVLGAPRKATLRAALTWVQPRSSHPGDYRIFSLAGGLSYDVVKLLRLFLLVRIDESRQSDGSEPTADGLGIMAQINF